MAYNKIIYGGKTLIDLTQDTVTAESLAEGVTAHAADGSVITGTSTKDSDTKDATAKKAEILVGKTAYVNGVKVEGSMPDNGAIEETISTKTGTVTVPQGYHDGSGRVSIDAVEQAKIIPSNIREGVTILGVVGTMNGAEGEIPQANKSVTPSTEVQTIVPDEEFTCLKQVTVAAIPYKETANAQGGITVTIG